MQSVTGSGERPRVLRIVTRLNIGGPSIQATRLTSELRARGYDTWLLHGRVAASEGSLRDLLPPGDPQVLYVDSLQRPIAPRADAAAFRAISSAINTIQPDIVHTHMAKAGLLGRLATALYNRTAGSQRRARIVHTYHGHVLEGYFSATMSRAVIQSERWLSRVTDRLIAISPRIADELVDRYAIAPRDKFEIVPLGFNLQPLAAVDDAARAEARAALHVAAGALVITTVGRLTAIKNHELFLAAARDIAAAIPHAVFLIAGDGELRASLEARAADLGIAERVRFLGWRRDLPVLYGATDLFVLASLNEGTPVALIEAMAAAVPGVATDVGGVADVIASADLGRLVPSNQPEPLAQAVLELAPSAALRRQIGERARASVLTRYDESRLFDDIERLYRRLGVEADLTRIPAR